MKLTIAISGYCLDRAAAGYAPGTISAHKSSLKLLAEFLEDPDIEKVTVGNLKEFFYFLNTEYRQRIPTRNTEPLSAAGIHGKWKAVRSLWNWASEELKISNIAKEIPAPQYQNRTIIPFTHEEVQKLIKACETTLPAQTGNRQQYTQKRPTVLRDKALLILLLDTGIRIGECSRLKVEDVNLEAGEIEIRSFRSGRKSKARIVQMGSACRRSVWRYIAAREVVYPSDPLFLNDENQPWHVDSIKHLIQRLGVKTGIKAHAHKFRHTFAIEYLRNGGDPFTLQRLLGHSTMEMVNRYLEIVQSDLAAAHKRASPADRWRL
jgi:integrase/recombinase XerD